MKTAAVRSDAELVELCKRGDEIAWRDLVTRYECLVFSVALGTGLDREAAADVYQQVWLELHRSLRRLRDPKALPRWLIVTTRRRAYRLGIVSSARVEGVREEMVDPRALPDEEVEALETRRRLEHSIDQLGEPCASVIRLLYLHPGKNSYRDVSRRAKIKMGSIGPTRARCLIRLRAYMDSYEPTAEEA